MFSPRDSGLCEAPEAMSHKAMHSVSLVSSVRMTELPLREFTHCSQASKTRYELDANKMGGQWVLGNNLG